MSSFIKRASCMGAVPQSVPNFTQTRPFTLRKLVELREEVRLLAAPTGYGKSAVAALYANTMFGFKKTYWFSCTSPCFLRDLDESSFLPCIKKYVDAPSLVVFDDLVHLNEKRQAIFNDLISELILQGVEVLITMAPEARNSFDDLAGIKVLEADDFLISDAEVAMYRSCFVVKDPLASQPHKRVPCIFLEVAEGELFNGMQTHGDTKEKLLLEFLMFIVRSGTFAELASFTNFDAIPVLEELSQTHPHFGIDVALGTFDCVQVSYEEIKKNMSFAFSSITRVSQFDDINSLVKSVALLMANKGMYDEASEFVNLMLQIRGSSEWYLRNASEFVNGNAGHLVLNSLSINSQQLKEARHDVCSLCALLEFNYANYPDFLNCYRVIVNSHLSAPIQRLFAQILFARVADAEDRLDACSSLLETYNEIEKQGAASEGVGFLDLSLEDLKFLSNFLFVLSEGKVKALVFLLDTISGELGENLSVAAVNMARRWMIEEVRAGAELNESAQVVIYRSLDGIAAKQSAYELFIGMLRDIFGDVESALFDEVADFYLEQCGMEAYRFVHDFNLSVEDFALPEVCEHLLKQNAIYLEDKNLALGSFRGGNARKNAHTRAIMRETADTIGSNAVVEFSFFGTPTCKIEGRFVDSDLLHRKNCLLILFFVFYNKGIEISRSELFDKIWGKERDGESSKMRSFYNATARIKRELNLNGREIFKKSSTGYYIDPFICKCDLDDFSKLCTNLTFNLLSTPSWQGYFANEIAKFAKPLMPQIKQCEVLNEIRTDYATRLTDALVSATDAMYKHQDYHASLWFANEAKHLNRGREDIYMAIMRAQNALSQRTEAVSTYVECKNYMIEEMGLAPTKGLQELYDSIILA